MVRGIAQVCLVSPPVRQVRSRALVCLVSCLSALTWFVGWPFATFAGAGGLSEDGFYFVAGLTTAVVGVLITPAAVCPWRSNPTPAQRTAVAIGGLAAAVCLFVTGLLVALGAVGFLGEHAPSMLLDVWPMALWAFFLWVLLASLVWGHGALDKLQWLAIPPAASVPVLVGILLALSPSATVATVLAPVVLIGLMLGIGVVWLYVLVWFVVVGVRALSDDADARR